MTERVLEVVIQAREGEDPAQVAEECARQLNLGNGVLLSVVSGRADGRPRRFVVQGGRIISPGQHAAELIADAVDEILRREGRPMDAWDLLSAARHGDSAAARATLATISRAARLLVRQGRARQGQEPHTWVARRTAEAVA